MQDLGHPAPTSPRLLAHLICLPAGDTSRGSDLQLWDGGPGLQDRAPSYSDEPALSRSSCVSLASEVDSMRPTCPWPQFPCPLKDRVHPAAPTTQWEKIHSFSSPPCQLSTDQGPRGPLRREREDSDDSQGHRVAKLGPWLLPGSGHKVWGARSRAVSRPWNGLAWVTPGGALTYHVNVHVSKNIPRECP